MFFLYILFIINLHANEESSANIQKEINSRANQIDLLKKEIVRIEEEILLQTKTEINTSEILLNLKNKINLTEKLIKSINREEKRLQRQNG